MRQRGAKFRATVDGSEWLFRWDQKNEVFRAKVKHSRITYTISPSQLVDAALGQKTFPIFTHEERNNHHQTPQVQPVGAPEVEARDVAEAASGAEQQGAARDAEDAAASPAGEHAGAHERNDVVPEDCGLVWEAPLVGALCQPTEPDDEA